MSVKTLSTVIAIAGFSLIVAPALLASNDLLDNTTFTVLFAVGFILILVSASARQRSKTIQELQ